MGQKYVIEVDRIYHTRAGASPDELFAIKGFNSLVFDQNGLDKLERLEHDSDFTSQYQDGYHQGLEDAWELATKVVYREDDVRNAFNDWSPLEILDGYSVTEAMKKIGEWEERNEIKVGDIITDGSMNYLVTEVTKNSYMVINGTDFEPVSIGKDCIRRYQNLHGRKDSQ